MRDANRRYRLRSATQEAHARVDALVEAAGFFDDRERYAAYLEATWRTRRGIERALDRGGAESLYTVWPYRRIAPALRADLCDVSGREPPDIEPQTTLACTSAQALGILYVLEGSALGARVLAPRAAALGMRLDFGARHLALQISTPGAWTTFLATLETAVFDFNQENACVAAALSTFAQFESAYAARP